MTAAKSEMILSSQQCVKKIAGIAVIKELKVYNTAFLRIGKMFITFASNMKSIIKTANSEHNDPIAAPFAPYNGIRTAFKDMLTATPIITEISVHFSLFKGKNI